jgi:hypothetical protein
MSDAVQQEGIVLDAEYDQSGGGTHGRVFRLFCSALRRNVRYRCVVPRELPKTARLMRRAPQTMF